MKFPKKINKKIIKIFFCIIIALILTSLTYFHFQKISSSKTSTLSLKTQIENLIQKEKELQNKLQLLENEDQYVVNKQLKTEIDNIHKTYQKSVDTYEKLLHLKTLTKKTDKFDEMFTSSLVFLSENNYASAEAILNNLNKNIADEETKIASTFKIPENLPIIDVPPSSGYRRQTVNIDSGSFMVDIVSADLNSTRVIVDTASESDCADNCPVLALSEYVSRNGAFAGINGSYFCPSTYPSCAGKTNSFDTLLMNKNKQYFNSDNNVYSTVPAVIFSGGSVRFVSKSLEWGRDTGVDGVIANYPLLTQNGQIVFNGDDDTKQSSKGGRSFVGATGNTVYIGVVHNATVAQSAKVLNSLGIANALNLDNGGSTALWSSGYKSGPGRNIPNAILFVKK
jgi:exopolysaccharide biosynthesis protein